MEFTGERFVPGIAEDEIGIEHYLRYYAINDIVKDKSVIDIACGTGYGSFLLAECAKEVIGIDISDSAIEYANDNYKRYNTEYIVGTIENIPCKNNSVDIVVSFETFEHVSEIIQNKFIREVKRVLKTDGLLILSTPNKYYYSDLPNYNNEFHVKELYEGEFLDVISNEFNFFELYYQSFNVAASITKKETSSIKLFDNYSEKGKYMVAICSDKVDVRSVNISAGFLNVQALFHDGLFDMDDYLYITRQKITSSLFYLHKETIVYKQELKYNITPVGYEISVDIEVKETEVSSIRWDPLEGRLIRVKKLFFTFVDTENKIIDDSLLIIKSNGTIIDDEYTFTTIDPQFYISNIPKNAAKFIINCKIEELDENAIEKYLQRLSGFINTEEKIKKQVFSLSKNLNYTQNIVKKRDQQLEIVNKEIARVGSELSAAQEVVRERDQQLEIVNKEIARVGSELSAAQEVVRERDQQLEVVNKEIARVGSELSAAQEVVRERDQQLEVVNKEIVRVGSELSAAQKVVRERDQQLEVVKKEIARVGSELSAAQEVVRERDQQLEIVNKEIARVGKELEHAQSIVVLRDQQIKEENSKLIEAEQFRQKILNISSVRLILKMKNMEID